MWLTGIKSRGTDSSLEPHVNQINILAILLLAGISLGVRYSHKATWLVSPLLTGICFYYFSWVDFDPQTVTQVFTSLIAVSCAFFIAVLFNETWLISTALYLPMLGFYMAKLG